MGQEGEGYRCGKGKGNKLESGKVGVNYVGI